MQRQQQQKSLTKSIPPATPSIQDSRAKDRLGGGHRPGDTATRIPKRTPAVLLALELAPARAPRIKRLPCARAVEQARLRIRRRRKGALAHQEHIRNDAVRPHVLFFPV